MDNSTTVISKRQSGNAPFRSRKKGRSDFTEADTCGRVPDVRNDTASLPANSVLIYLLGNDDATRVEFGFAADVNRAKQRLKAHNTTYEAYGESYNQVLALVWSDKSGETNLKTFFADKIDGSRRTENIRVDEDVREYIRWLRLKYYVSESYSEANTSQLYAPPNEWSPYTWSRSGDKCPSVYSCKKPDKELISWKQMSLFSGCDEDDDNSEKQHHDEIIVSGSPAWKDVLSYVQTDGDYYTPNKVVQMAREVMGGIDLDPASCKAANKVARATRIFTKIPFGPNGLNQPWSGRVWLNPPFNEWKHWAPYAAGQIESGLVTQLCVYVTTSASTGITFSLLSSKMDALCISRGRRDVQCWGPKASAAPDGVIIFYYGPNVDAFLSGFASIGLTAKISPFASTRT